MRVWLLLAASLFSQAALADLFTAQLAYRKGDYARAFKDYRELAELGQPIAQYNLAILYENGEGVRQSDLNAYAWAKLAGENGSAQGKALADKLRPQLAPGSEVMAAEIIEPYSRTVLDARLMPKLEENEALTSPRCKARKTKVAGGDVYPDAARNAGTQGRVFVAFTVMPDGSSRNPRIFYAVPPHAFESAVRVDIMHLHATPDVNAAPAECYAMYNFSLDSGYMPRLGGYADELKKKANGGDVQAAFDYGLLAAAFPGVLHTQARDAVPWFLKAAQTGSPNAQFVLGSSLLFGWGCQCDETKAEVWLRSAAAADNASAQVTLAAHALRGTRDSAHAQMAATWLARAATSNDREGMFYFAALLAATPEDGLRDPKRALELIGRVEGDFSEDPTTYEIRAAAQAASGDYHGAGKSEERAIGQATKLEWDLAPLKERLARYQAGKPWTGYLLSF